MEIRPAATLVLTRDSDHGLEVLLLQRTWDAVFLPGYHVFPGGAVDNGDVSCRDRMTGADDQAISQTMSLDEGGADYMIAAVRECFEEAGILLAMDRDGQLPSPEHPVFDFEWAALNQGEVTMAELLQRHDLTLPLDRLGYLSHWITPPGPPRRFDTRFFVAVAPAGQQARHDGVETIDHRWICPQQALAQHRQGQLLLGLPTIRTLRLLADFNDTRALMTYAHANPPEPYPTRSWPAYKDGRRIEIEPGAPAYDEVRKLDPTRDGTASAAIVPGEPVTLGPGVQRLTAPNPGMMTGPGTNCYLLGTADRFMVIDPGPADDGHIERILELTGGRISHVLVTHTHRDHSPAARVLRERTGARLVGIPAPEGASQDASFEPDLIPRDGEPFGSDAGPLRAILTPGHASNHVCYLLENQHILFSGDHIMQGSTVVINPPDGDMGAYLSSLGRLLEETIRFIAPGHGFLMGNPHAAIDHLTTHRLAREHKVVKALQLHGPGTLKELTPHIYDDVPPALHGLASRSALAHLLKLAEERIAHCAGEQWQWLGRK